MNNKAIYTIWTSRQQHLPIFLQPWWMDAVCAGKQWDVLLTFSPSAPSDKTSVPNEQLADELMAAMPYLIRERFKMKYIIMPQLTQLNGIWIDEKILQSPPTPNESEDDNNNIEDERKKWLMYISTNMKNQLDSMGLSYYYQQYTIDNPILTYLDKKHFTVKHRHTYRIDATCDLDSISSHFDREVRRRLRKALSLRVDQNLSPEEFYSFLSHSMASRKRQLSYTREFFLVLERKVIRFQKGTIIAIKNLQNAIVAAAFLVWDETAVYYLISAFDPVYKTSGGSTLLVWEAVKLAHSMNLAFDFEGGMATNIGSFYRQFASTPTPYYSVQKIYKPLFRLALLYNWFNKKKFRGL